MNYQNAKIYFDGGHYIAIPQGAFPSGKGSKKSALEIGKTINTQHFKKAYKESLSMPKRERKQIIVEAIKEDFNSEKELKAFVDESIGKEETNEIRRKVRLMRKLYLQEWNYFCTFTYDENLLDEQSFRKKLSNTLKHLVYRNGWKYIGVWEKSPEKGRLHFHGIFYIPKMIGTIIEVVDYNTTNHRKQITHQNTHFIKQFGRNDFKEINNFAVNWVARYITKYMQKSGEKLVFGGKIPTYFRSDLLESDVACPIGIDGRKALLFDNFTCMKEGEIIGTVSKETIAKLPKCN